MVDLSNERGLFHSLTLLLTPWSASGTAYGGWLIRRAYTIGNKGWSTTLHNAMIDRYIV